MFAHLTVFFWQPPETAVPNQVFSQPSRSKPQQELLRGTRVAESSMRVTLTKSSTRKKSEVTLNKGSLNCHSKLSKRLITNSSNQRVVCFICDASVTTLYYNNIPGSFRVLSWHSWNFFFSWIKPLHLCKKRRRISL